jgi:hypothetical protein
MSDQSEWVFGRSRRIRARIRPQSATADNGDLPSTDTGRHRTFARSDHWASARQSEIAPSGPADDANGADARPEVGDGQRMGELV